MGEPKADWFDQQDKDWFAEQEKSATTQSQKSAPSAQEGGGIGHYLSSAWEKVNPIPVAKSLYAATQSPLGNALGPVGAELEIGKNIGLAHAAVASKAIESFKKGDYQDAAVHALNTLIPLIGPAIDAAAEKGAKGDWSGALGDATGLAASIAGPELAGRAIGATGRALTLPNRNPVEAAAVKFGQAQGIPVDAATATGNPAVQGIQALADRSLGGTLIAERAKAAQQSALARTGESLASRAHPTAVTAEQAGESVRTAIQAKIDQLHAAANDAYGDLRDIERSNAVNVQTGTRSVDTGVLDASGKPIVRTTPVTETVTLPVQMGPVKAALKPIYDQLLKTMPIAQQQASKGLLAIKNIVEGPDVMSASAADQSLSAIKSVAREADNPALRNVSQGLAAKAVGDLDIAVRKAVAQGGPDAVAALERGRALTRAKYQAADVLDTLSKEPVGTFNQATWAKDAGIARLRQVAREAPAAMAQIGRAYLDNLLEKATGRGGFQGGASLLSSWEKLGPQTKAILFKDPGLVSDLDKFFLLAKKIAENPNPSGSAHLASLGAQAAGLFTFPLTTGAAELGAGTVSALMHSRAGVQLLTRGLAMRSAPAIARAATGAQLVRLAQQQGLPVTMVPAMAGDTQP